MNTSLNFNFILVFLFFISVNLFSSDNHLFKTALIEAYPKQLSEIVDNVLIWQDGTKMVYDDKKDKSFKELLNFPDIEDQMLIEYPITKDFKKPLIKNQDPGRIRYEPFFRKIYGNSKKEVFANLVAVHWLPSSVDKVIMVNSVNGVDKKIKAISDELDKLPNNLKKYVVDIAGTFNWRKISGTNRLSTHSFGIAIDINTKYANYWKWDKLKIDNKLTYKNQIPMQIVEIFEKHGFIWGGKWYHYDTMHFEYRPELLR